MRHFPKKDLVDLVWNGGSDGYAVVHDEHVDSSRWEEIHQLVFSHDGENWLTTYTLGLTEMQDIEPFEDDPDEIPCHPAVAREVTTIKWEAVPS